MEALLAPVPPVDAGTWASSLADAKSKLAGLAVRRAGTVRFRITDHEIRTALAGDTFDAGPGQPFAWSARTGRRAIGVAAVRTLASGDGALPLEAVRSRLTESSRGSPMAVRLRRSSTAGSTDSPWLGEPLSVRKP